MSKIVIIGAGIAGLSTAYKLIENNINDIIILESSDKPGGLSKSISNNGFIYDLGPHQIHTENKTVIDFLKQVLKDDLIIEKKKASHWFMGKYLNYPLGINDILFGLPFNVSSSCFLDFCKQRFINIFKEQNNSSFESWVINNFGKKMYDIYFGPYTQKVWGKHPSKLAAICAQERIAVQNLWDILLSAMSKKVVKFSRHYHLPHSPYQKIFYYPRYGIGQLAEIMSKFITDNGGKIIYNAKVSKIQKDNSSFKIHTEDKQELTSKFVVSTIPVNELYNNLSCINGNIHQKQDASLEFRAITFVFMEINQNKLTDNHWIYFPDKDFLFQRASEFKNFSSATCPPGKTGICFEIPCDYNDNIWNMDDTTLYEKTIDSACKENFIKKEWAIGYTVHHEKYAYPTYSLDYKKNLDIITNYLSKIDKLFTIGRQGRFRYINIDEVMLMGFDVANKLSNDLNLQQ